MLRQTGNMSKNAQPCFLRMQSNWVAIFHSDWFRLCDYLTKVETWIFAARHDQRRLKGRFGAILVAPYGFLSLFFYLSMRGLHGGT